MDSAGMWFIGNEEQNCEAGGEDLGANGASAGNFGAGQMVVGQDSQATYVHLKDSINNGNRTGGKPEALYLYGLNGENGLRILGGSTLFLDDLHAYAKIDGNMVHLNSLVPPGAPQVEFDEGYLRVTMPDPNDMLHVHFHTPRGPVYEPVDHVEIRFNRPVNPDTFDPNDIIITGPNGPLDPNDIKGVIPVDPEGYAWQIEFTEQYINGDYSLTIGPHIEDLDGQEMDESGNGNPGESGDAYPAEFTIYIGVDVHILSPEDGSVYDIGDSIPFKASGLTGSPPIDDTWSSNIDGEFSNRQEENVSTLSIGEHIITLLGTDQVNDTDEEQIALALLADNIIEAGGSIHRIQVTYTDNFAIDASSLNFGDIWITGPHDYGKPAKYISKDALGDGSPRSATYGVLSPGEEWDMTDNGIYYVQLRSETVKDINGNYADGRFLGTFEVAIAENCYQVASLNQLDKRRVGRSEYEYRFNVILRTSHCAEESDYDQ
jgi:hypothetical protein